MQIILNVYLKGQCHEVFCFRFYSWITFPQAPEYIIRVVSNFFENSRRNSQLKVCHRWQMQKIFNNKKYSTILTYCMYLKGQCHEIFASGFFHESVSPQLQSIPFRPFRIFSKICGDIRESRCTTGINDTGGKFATGINDTGGKFLHHFC